MIKKLKALKIVSYITLGIVLMLFFGFLLTYDFSTDNDYCQYATYDDASVAFDKIVSDSIDSKSGINVANIELNSDYFNKLFVSIIRDNNNSDEYLYDNDVWKVKGLNVDFKDGEIIFSFHLRYDRFFSYDTRLKIHFSFSETDDELRLELRKLLVGQIIVPRSIIRNVLSENRRNSIGGIFNDLIKLLPFGSYHGDSLSYTIRKIDLSRAVELGYIGSRAFDDNYFLMDVSASYISFLFPNNMISIECDNNLVITLDYSKAIIDYNTMTNDLEARRIQYLSGASLENKNYIEKMKFLLSDDIYSVKNSDIESLYFYNLISYEYSFMSDYVSMISSKFSIIGDDAHIVLYFRFFDMYSKVDYIYEYDDGKYILKRIEIGRDDNELPMGYLTLKSQAEMETFIRTLSSIGFNSDYITHELDLSSVMSIDFDYESYNKTQNGFDFILKNNENKDKIKEAMLSSEFKEYIENESLEYDNSSTGSIIESFSNMNQLSKEKFFYLLKDFFKTDTIVYNYIENILSLRS